MSPIEPLEQRALLTADPLPTGTALVGWGGSQVPAISGSFVLTFDTYLGNQQAQLMAREVATRLGVDGSNFQSIGRGGWASFTTADPVSFTAAENLTHVMAHLSAIEPNQVFSSARVPNDPRYSDQWGLNNTGQIDQNGIQGTIGADIHAQQAWDTTIGSRNVIVADIDTGIDLTHPDLIPNLWTNPGEVAGNGLDDDGNGFVDDVHGYDFGEQTGSPQDTEGHGTMTAGVIGAAGNNNLGVTGVAWNVSIMALKIADAQGRLTLAAIVGAQDYATMMRERGFNIVVSNNSYGGYQQGFYANAPQGFSAERDAIQRFLDSVGPDGTRPTFVASAGNGINGVGVDNDNPNFKNFPSSYNIPGIISVAASDNNDGIASFSNYGAQTVTIAAPGVNILSTQLGGGYFAESGTSFSGPMVAGAVALLKTVVPNASAVEIREALINSADQLPAFQGKVVAGGRLNIARALQIIGISGPTLRAVTPGPVVGQINPATSQPFNSAVVTLSHDIDPASLSIGGVTLIGAGTDGVFGTGDDITVPITSIALSPTNPRVINITLNLSAFPLQRLPVGQFHLTLSGSVGTGIRDTDGNYLNGNNAGGTDEVYSFRVVGATGDNEPNDTLAEATPVTFDTSGAANFSGATIGNGINVNLDVDIYRIDMARGGLITAEVTAKRLPSPSTLDSYLRLFNAAGQEIANNDQFFGQDSFIDFFVTTGGTYYVGVSGFGNPNYDPNVGGSGSSQSTGVYNLRLQVALESDDVVSYNSSSDPTMPRRIPFAENQTQGTTTAVINVADTREILDVNVQFDIQHTFDGDLQISLIDPTGLEVMLVNRRGGNGDNFSNTIIDDEATTPISAGVAPFNGSYRAEASLGAFDGHNANGNWTLKIVDAAPLNSGQLNSWSLTFTLQNNIFGPFESNDTLATAKDLQEISPTGTGSATRTAFIGDGGFGNFDRDIFKFTAAAGSSLNANVTSAGALNSAIRLFDSSGNQILLSNPDGTNNSGIDNFVFANGGTYYLAVSESNNVAYDPTMVASGVSAASTGTYTLVVTLAAGVSDSAMVLNGNALSVGINPGGTFSGPGNVGLKYNGVEFLPTATGRPQMFLGALVSGYNFSDAGPAGTNDLPFSLTSESDTFNNRVVAKANFRGVDIERTISYGKDDSFAAVDVYFTNAGAAQVTNLAWMEGFNPDPGVSLGDTLNNLNTSNDVDATGHMVSATYTNNQFLNGLTVAMAAPTADARAKATVVDTSQTVRDPSILLSQAINDPNGVSSDGQLVMSFNMGNLNPGATTSIRYFIFFGTDPASVNAMYAQVNNGTGTGHLTADPANPALEALDTGTGTPVAVPTLPYKVYYPEGFFGDNIFTFVPISNMSDQAANVYIIAHYETGNRDQIVGHLSIAANARSGITITTPELFHNGGVLAGRVNTPYALEVRSDRPVAAMFSHYDEVLLNGHAAAIGESFTSDTNATWSFGQVNKGNGNVDFLVFYNPTDTFTKVTAHYFPVGGGTPITETFNLDPHRRGGFAINDAPGLADGAYGATITSDMPIIASISHYNFTELNADGALGNTGLGATTGVIPEGQFGINSPNDTIGVLNPGSTAATVVLSFLFQNGSAYRTSLAVAAGSHAELQMDSLANFPHGIPYGTFFESNVPVSVSSYSRAFGDLETSTVTDTASTVWGFGEGFRPGDGSGHPGVIEKLRLYNPSETDQTVEITIGYDGGLGVETFRRTITARTVTEFDMDQFITGDRRTRNPGVWFGTTIKAPVPIVAYMDHYDKSFNGTVPDPTPGAAFGTLGTPLGNTATVS